MSDKKICTKCGDNKFLKEFNSRGGKQSHLLLSWCKQCHKTYNKSRTKTRWEKLAFNASRKGDSYIRATDLRENLGDPDICYLCGLPVSWETAELDHVIPISRGGENAIHNFKWAHRICNRIKHNLNINEMLELFQEIINNQQE